jgi:hypothetical protein
MSITSTQAPLKGIPFGGPQKAMPIHLKNPQLESAGDSLNAKDLLPSAEDDRVDKGLLDWVFGGGKSDEAPVLPEPRQFKLGNATINGHLASDPQHANYPSSRYEIRTFMPVAGGEVASIDFKQLLETVKVAPMPSKTYVVTRDQVQAAIDSTSAERQQQLDDPSKLHDGNRVVPKDATLNPTEVTMYLRSRGDVSTRYVEQMSQIGKIEGFHMVAGIGAGQTGGYQQELKGYDNISLMEVPHGEVWVEDYSEPTLGGGQVTPAIFDDSWGSLIKNAITEGREQRFSKLGLDGAFAYHGAVNQGKFQQTALARGIAEQGPLRQALSYMEGGNNYTGTRPNGEGFILVGKDSWHVSKKLLEKQTGREWSDAEVAKVIAADTGLKTENVIPVEQPAAFHLDMRMTAIAPGEFILNDSVMACEQQLSWMREDVQNKLAKGEISQDDATRANKAIDRQAKGMMEQAKRMKPYEDLTAQDLEGAGMKVHRIGGSFVDPSKPTRDTANYFNARHFTNEQGERISVLMGGKSREEAYMAQKLVELTGGDISRIHFLDPSVTQSTLDLWGGLKCRTKPEGDLVSQALIADPNQAALLSA